MTTTPTPSRRPGPITAEEITRADIVYSANYETKEDGRDLPGWYLCSVKRDDPGYYQLKPGYGPYPNEQACREEADKLNMRMGIAKKDAIDIVMSSIGAQMRQGRHRSTKP